MAYVTQQFGCAGGRGCGCSSCGCRSRLGEWYVRDDDDDDDEARPVPTAKPPRPAVAPRAAPRIGWLGEPPTTAPAQGPDTMERICRSARELIQGTDHFGMRITVHQQNRIRCIVAGVCQPDFDDRYLTGQGVLDYNNGLYSEPYYARARQWLLPEFAVRAGTLRPDQDLWRTLIRIDDDIIQGRGKINYYYHTHGEATPIRIRRLRDWVARQQDNRRSIYWCYRP